MLWRTVDRRLFFMAVGGVAMMIGSAQPAYAGTLLTVRDYFGRQAGNLPSGEQHQIFFTPVTTMGGASNSVIFEFPDADDGLWCRTAGDLTVTPISDPAGSNEGATPLPGILVGTCTQGVGGGSIDTLRVDNVGPLNASTKYGFSLADGTLGQLGTPPPSQGIMVQLKTNNGTADVDTKIFFLSILGNDQVAVSATVVATPPTPTNPIIELKGYAAPGAALVVDRDGTQVATATADTSASFDILLADQPTGQHVYDISASDTTGVAMPMETIAANLAVNSTTIISDIFFGPSISLSPSSLELGQTLSVHGMTTTDSAVTLTITGPPDKALTVTSDANGRWSASIITTNLGVGNFSIQGKTTTSANLTSDDSFILTFRVTAPPSQPPTLPKPPLPPAIKISDINGDGRTDLIDFSILLFFWNTTNPSNRRADINHDGRVNLVDFSILFYQWTG